MAAQLLERVNVEERKQMLEIALEAAIADEAWWLIEDLLKLQFIVDLESGGDGMELRNHLEQLAKELDDSFTLWEIIRQDKQRQKEANVLEERLRSPLEKSSG